MDFRFSEILALSSVRLDVIPSPAKIIAPVCTLTALAEISRCSPGDRFRTKIPSTLRETCFAVPARISVIFPLETMSFFMDRRVLFTLLAADWIFSGSMSFVSGWDFCFSSTFGRGAGISSVASGCSRVTDFILNSPFRRGLHSASKCSRSTEKWLPSGDLTFTPFNWSPRPWEKLNPIDSIATLRPVSWEIRCTKFSFTVSRSICERMITRARIRAQGTPIHSFRENRFRAGGLFSLEGVAVTIRLKLSGDMPIPE